MEITETLHPHATVLALTGRLDGVTSPILEQRIAAARAAGATTLIFNLSGLAYVSSAGLRILLATAKTAQATGGRATFVALPATVREVFGLSGFLTVLDVRPDLASALV
jgi:anti-anti-sigma factor